MLPFCLPCFAPQSAQATRLLSVLYIHILYRLSHGSFCFLLISQAPQNKTCRISSNQKLLGAIRSSVAVLGLDVVGKGLGLLVLGVVVVVAVVVVLGTDKVHLVDAAALGAALNGAVLGELMTRSS